MEILRNAQKLGKCCGLRIKKGRISIKNLSVCFGILRCIFWITNKCKRFVYFSFFVKVKRRRKRIYYPARK